MRHLAAPKNPVTKFRFVCLHNPLFRSMCRQAYVEDYDGWQKRKGQNKMRRIETSAAEDRVDFTRVKMMVKREVSARSVVSPTPIKKARGIQFAVNEHTAYAFVREFDAFSKALALFSEIPHEEAGVHFVVVYASKMNHSDIANFATESESVRRHYAASIVHERDGQNWDSNVQRAHREALCAVYEECLGSRFADYVRTGIAVNGTYVGKDGATIKYWVDATVKSGHGDTSCGNGALNREITIQALVRVGPRWGLVRVRALVMGDDYIAWLYFNQPVDWAAFLQELTAAERAFGIVPVGGLFADLRNASFISLGFYRTIADTWVALPKVGRLLARLFWTVTPLQGRDPRRLASGIAQSFYPLFSTCPFMRKFLRHHMQVPPIDVTDYNHYYEWAEIGLTRLPAPINWAENHLIKYGPDAVLLDLEMPLEQGAGLAWHPVVDHMYTIDTSDPPERPGCVAST